MPTHKKQYGVLPFSPVITLLGAVVIILLGLFVFSATHIRPRADKHLNSYERGVQLGLSSTADWKTYTDTTEGMSVQYPEGWSVSTQTIDHGTIIFFAPKEIRTNSDKIKIIVTDNGYFGIDGLPTKPVTIAGQEGIMVDTGLYGIKHNGHYITFDAGNANSAPEYVSKMIGTVQFK